MNQTIIVLLGIIAVAEVVRLVLTQRKPSKKSHFKQKLAGVEKMGWDLEFKVFKTKEIREEIRRTHSDTKSRLLSLSEQIKNWPEGKEGKGAAEDQKVLLEKDIERYETQMKNLDIEISGSPKTNEYPDGVQGINDEMDSYKELEGMLKDHINSI